VTRQAVQQAVELAGRGARVLVATASAEGVPHLAAAGGVQGGAGGTLEITAWFCPGTLENLERNPRLSLTVWDPGADRGHQIVGDLERIDTRALLDGFAYGLESDGAVPQVERTIVMRPRRALVFTHAPHTDREE
jgi:hypothetical protein